MDFDPLFEDVYSTPFESLNENNNPESSESEEQITEDSSEETGIEKIVHSAMMEQARGMKGKIIYFARLELKFLLINFIDFLGKTAGKNSF